MKLAILASLLPLAGVATAADRAPDAALIDPDSHVVVFENEHVRVLENLSAPGKSSPTHSHSNMLIISLDKARLRMTVSGQEPFIFDLNPGQVLWMGDAEHSWELLAGQLHVFGIEIK